MIKLSRHYKTSRTLSPTWSKSDQRLPPSRKTSERSKSWKTV